MTSNRSKESRSSSGCWTCRLRRKKCDEGQPRCTNCNLLQISCFGYGPKPDWMDSGDMEKAVARATLDAVRQTTARNHNRRMRRSQNLSTSAISHNDSTSSSLQTGNKHDIATSATEVEQDIDFYDISPYDLSNFIPQNPTILPLEKSVEEQAPVFCHRNPLLQQHENLGITKGARNISQDTYNSIDNIEERSACSIMDYMDSVFFLQFPLHGPLPTLGGRGWLLWLLMHVRPLRIITDALCAQCHLSLRLQSSRASFTFTQDREVEETFSLLLSELNHYIGRVSSQEANIRDGKIGILACTVQLIFIEVFQGGSLTWRTHLEAAASLVAFLTTDNYSTQSSTPPYLTAYDEAFKFFAGLFIWLDVISAASTGTKHLSQEEDERLLESNITDLGSLVGCENWIVLTILKVTALSHWKKERERDGRLSFTELVRRSEPLERRLKQCLTRMPSSLHQSAINCDPPTATGNLQKDIVTTIFVGSTLSYLHFVVSGPFPELVEIRESITITIEAFKKLPHPWLLRSLVWPFCITGCFALPEERPLLRMLVTAAGVNSSTGGSLWKSLEVIEQCWKIQETSHKLCDWREGARSLGYDILFI